MPVVDADTVHRLLALPSAVGAELAVVDGLGLGHVSPTVDALHFLCRDRMAMSARHDTPRNQAVSAVSSKVLLLLVVAGM